jgi:hypothetical protein
MKVRKLTGAAQGSGSSLVRWERISGLRAVMCLAKSCFGRPSVGAHVQKDSMTDKGWYIVPLCSGCSAKRGRDLDIWDHATLVGAAGDFLPGTMPRRSTARPVPVFSWGPKRLAR